MEVSKVLEASNLSGQQHLEFLRQMILIRRFEEKCAELYSESKIRGFLHLYIGEEAVAVGAMKALHPEDNIVATYREHGQAIARGMSPGAVMAEMYGKVNGCSRGRGGSMHLFDASLRFYGGYAIVGGGMPIAVGLALADQMQKKEAITACFFGDGAVAEGEFHESLNLAALWKLPVLFLCENNFYAMGTALKRHQSQTDIAFKAAGYNIPSNVVDGMNILAVKDATERAADMVRRKEGPVLVEFQTYRFRAHSMYDPDLYRTKEEIEEWKKRDPIPLFQKVLRDQGLLNDSDLSQIEEFVQNEISKAIEFAETGEWETEEDCFRDVYTPRSV
jgi:pyruvate dehydrogenase E1 component alpha subunit